MDSLPVCLSQPLLYLYMLQILALWKAAWRHKDESDCIFFTKCLGSNERHAGCPKEMPLLLFYILSFFPYSCFIDLLYKMITISHMSLHSLNVESFLRPLDLFQVLSGHMWPEVIILDSTDREYIIIPESSIGQCCSVEYELLITV